MTRMLLTCLLAGILIVAGLPRMFAGVPVHSGLAHGVAQAAEVTVTSQIEDVLVFPTGAEITRVSKVNLEKGEHTIVLSDLPAQADAKSIRVEGRASGPLRIGSVDAARRFVGADDTDDAVRKRKDLEDKIRSLEDERAGLQGDVEAGETQLALLRNLISLPGAAPDPKTGRGDAKPRLTPDDLASFLALIGTGMSDVRRRIIETQAKIRETDKTLQELRKQLRELAPTQKERTEVKVFVDAGVPLEADLVVKYQVSNANWSPLYDARLNTGTKTQAPSLSLTRRAIIQQRSGEAWDNVRVRLSTTQPKAGSTAPELRPLVVDFRKPPPVRPMAGTLSMERAQDDAAPPVAAMAPRAAPGRVGRSLKKVTTTQARISNAPFSAIFEVVDRVSVAANGERKRVEISSSEITPTLTVRTVPKRDAKAYLYATVTLEQGAPMLSGPVALFRDGVYAGNGKLPTLAGGEEHDIGFGVDDLVRVRHTVAKDQRGETGLISSSRTDNRSFRITVKNLHERPIPVTVIDQVPVAGNEDIKIDILGTPPDERNFDDKRGVIAWVYDLAANEERSINFGYRVTWPAAKQIQYRGGR